MSSSMSRICALVLLVAAAAAEVTDEDCNRLRDCEAMGPPSTPDEYRLAVAKCDGRSFNLEMMKSCGVELAAANDTGARAIAPLENGGWVPGHSGRRLPMGPVAPDNRCA